LVAIFFGCELFEKSTRSFAEPLELSLLSDSTRRARDKKMARSADEVRLGKSGSRARTPQGTARNGVDATASKSFRKSHFCDTFSR